MGVLRTVKWVQLESVFASRVAWHKGVFSCCGAPFSDKSGKFPFRQHCRKSSEKKTRLGVYTCSTNTKRSFTRPRAIGRSKVSWRNFAIRSQISWLYPTALSLTKNHESVRKAPAYQILYFFSLLFYNTQEFLLKIYIWKKSFWVSRISHIIALRPALSFLIFWRITIISGGKCILVREKWLVFSNIF